jgi:hypothetical protein
MLNHKTAVSQAMLLIGTVIVMILVTGCYQQSATPADNGAPTAPPAPSQTPMPTPTLQATLTLTVIPATPTSTPNLAATALAATAAACKPAAEVTDVTVPDGSRFKPGESFVKTWRFTSSGNCAWEKDTVLAFRSGESFSALDVALVDAVDIGRSIEISLTMKAPQRVGAYVGQWVLQRPSGQVITTTSLHINVFAPTAASAVALTPTAKPAASSPIGHIPPVGSGSFEADPSASGPWNCLGIATDTGYMVQWMGDFYIEVRGGPGDYTISDPRNCHWDLSQQKFVCRYGASIGQPTMQTLYVSCPGCAQKAVALSGRGVNSKEEGSGICRVRTSVVQTPTPGSPAAGATAVVTSASPSPLEIDKFASGPHNCALVGEHDWVGEFYIGVRGGSGNCTINDSEHCQWEASQQRFVCRYIANFDAKIMQTLIITCPGAKPQQVPLSGGVAKGPSGPGKCIVK